MTREKTAFKFIQIPSSKASNLNTVAGLVLWGILVHSSIIRPHNSYRSPQNMLPNTHEQAKSQCTHNNTHNELITEQKILSAKSRFHATPLLREEACLSRQAGRLDLSAIDHIHTVVYVPEKGPVLVIQVLELELREQTGSLMVVATVEPDLDLWRCVRVCIEGGLAAYERKWLMVERGREVRGWRV